MRFIQPRQLKFGIITLALVGVAAVAILQSEKHPPIPFLPGSSPFLGQVFAHVVIHKKEDTEQGVIISANNHNILNCGSSGEFGLFASGSVLASDITTRFWGYEYTGNEPPFDGRFFISEGEFASQSASVQEAYNSLLLANGEITEFIRGETYYLMTERDLTFKCGDGLDLVVVCGDGYVDAGEECDDGNQINDDECTNDCKLPQCGDGIPQSVNNNEECDDGNQDNTDDCLNTCVVAGCGDDYIWSGHEECDDGDQNSDTLADACRLDCKNHFCGDTVIDSDEDCEESSHCGTNYTCTDCSCVYAPGCGNGVIDPGEECDDGDTDDGNGCSATCTVEHGFECDEGEPSECYSTCGDGLVASDEECDDENADSQDGCSSECTVEKGWECSGEPSVCEVLIPVLR